MLRMGAKARPAAEAQVETRKQSPKMATRIGLADRKATYRVGKGSLPAGVTKAGGYPCWVLPKLYKVSMEWMNSRPTPTYRSWYMANQIAIWMIREPKRARAWERETPRISPARLAE